MQQLHGLPACTGLAKGKAIVIHDSSDLKKAKKGSILIAEKTIPAMIIAMEKCAGIVTETGGVTSHAAIVTRELGIPCIVGCKGACQKINDGNLLFLDATQGVVWQVSPEEYNHIKIAKPEKTESRAAHFEQKSTDREIIALEEVGEDLLPVVGGKAAKLGQVFKKYLVPKGFCITTKIFQEVWSHAKNHDEALCAEIPESIQKTLLAAFHTLHPPLAVRSSSILEDLPNLSFAGQYDTVLNVVDEHSFLDALKKCFASYYNERALAYRKKNCLTEEVPMAVLVQEIVQADKSGVAFSIDPVRKDPELIIVEAVHGLGEALVSGQINPDTYVVSKQDNRLIRKKGQILTDKEAKQVAKLAHDLEKYYGEAQDIEWALSKGRLYLLQTRNITNYRLDDLQKYLNASELMLEGFQSTETWPINSIPIVSYFDIDEALEMYNILEKIKKDPESKIKSLLPPAACLKYVLIHNGMIGLKVANHYKFSRFSCDELLNYFADYTKLMKLKQVNSPFDGRKKIIYTTTELEKVVKKRFCKTKEKTPLKKLITALDALIYSLYYDAFIGCGLERHGPYDVSKQFGEGSRMVVFDYFNLAPKEIWKHRYPYKKACIYLVYRDIDVQVDYINRLIAPEDFMQKITHYRIELGSRDTITEAVKKISDLTNKQTNLVESLSDLDQVRKGALIYHYQLKDLRKHYLGHWEPTYLEKAIQKFGDRFIKQFKRRTNTPKKVRRIFDPRIPWLKSDG